MARRAAEIKQLVGIEDVLALYGGEVPVSRYSGWRSMTCPFHDDRRASAGVDLTAGVFVCHGCGVKGDIFSIVMEQEELDFRGARAWIEEHCI